MLGKAAELRACCWLGAAYYTPVQQLMQLCCGPELGLLRILQQPTEESAVIGQAAADAGNDQKLRSRELLQLHCQQLMS